MKIIDPFYYFLKIILRKFYTANLSNEQLAFLGENITKHRKVLWINIVSCVLLFFAMKDTSPKDIVIVVTASIAPVMVMGAAWFAVSFGALPAKLIDVSMSVTFWLFSSFVVSFSMMFISTAFVVSPLFYPVLAIIYLGVIISCIQYDTADGLKAGLDEVVLTHGRYAIEHYKKQGITVKN